MQDIRVVLSNRLAETGMTSYRLWTLVKEHMSEASVHRFMTGKNDITTQKLSALLEVLDLEIRPKEGKSK